MLQISQLPTLNFQFSTFNCQLSTLNYKKNPSYATPTLTDGSSLYIFFKNRFEYSPLTTI